MKNYYKNGITLIEIIIVCAVLAVILAVALPQFSSIREKQVLKSAVGDILSSLNKAQGSTLASVDSSSYGVNFTPESVTIFKGTTFSEGNPDNEIIDLTSPASISNVTLAGTSGTSGNLYFNRLSGAPSKSGTITVSTPNFSKIITISATGSASSD